MENIPEMNFNPAPAEEKKPEAAPAAPTLEQEAPAAVPSLRPFP